MGDKKGKKKGGGEEDESTIQLSRQYKKKCELNGINPSKLFKEKLDFAVEEDENIEKIHLWEELGPVGVRSIMDSLTEIPYLHTKSIRLWKVKAQDEGTRTICNYMEKSKTIEYLDLMDNQVGSLGCEFLGRVLHPQIEIPLLKLKLDHNEFGTEGLMQLAAGLCMNSVLEKLSLNYCAITAEGSKYIQQILSFVNTNLKKLKMKGNLLKNEGVHQLFRAFKVNKTLEKVDLSDNQFDTTLGDDQDPEANPNFFETNKDAIEHNKQIIENICEVLKAADTLLYYDFRFNNISKTDAKAIIDCLEANKNIYYMELSEHIPKDMIERKKGLMKKRKPKKKKKKKGKKK
ncbi:hypothetical protein ABPG74_020151 [Tetrahymena malaccensis]